jgi:O-methyltransferase
MAPTYKYKISPGQIAALINLINDTRKSGGVVVEIGVAQGDTSAFILEHMRTTGDSRNVFFFDTFEGFTSDSIEYEVKRRGKSAAFFDKFRYGDEGIFCKNLASAGYKNFTTRKGDAATFDWSTLGSIGAVLLDIDLYKPTIDVLNNVWPYIVPGGGIVVDDCLSGTPWDGSLQAYEEFLGAKGLPFRMVGNKGGLLVKG